MSGAEHYNYSVVTGDRLTDGDCAELSRVKSMERLIDCSSRFVRDAYARMPQARQNWAKHADEEIAEILKMMPPLSRDAVICDFGSGGGRHLAALRAAGFRNVSGIDFALSSEGKDAGVIEADCRDWKSPELCDLILCLYDVIGSFAKEEDNLAILRNLARNLKPGGAAALSVANRDFAAASADIGKVDASDRESFLRKVFELPAANAMASDGEFFKRASLYDPFTGLFYHKEQFKDGTSALPAEYLIVDRRYTRAEIVAQVQAAGLAVVATRYVRSGFAKSFTAETGKEILVVCRAQGEDKEK